MRYLLKLNPAENPHLVVNEAAHLTAAKGLKIPVVKSKVLSDRNGLDGLLVDRFDRVAAGGGQWIRLPLEDGTQVMGLPPAAKYTVTSEEVGEALATHCQAPVVARRNIYLLFVFAWLTGNGDLHAKNLSILGKLALSAANTISLEELPFSGSPLRGAQRELRFRRAEFSD